MNRFSVRLAGRAKTISVRADYFKIDDMGVLTFRNTARGDQVYPTFVQAFAPGVWIMIRNEEATNGR